jgi:cation:H+ antiporter
MGTSFPELVASFAAVMRGVTDVVVANAVGSNIANILLVVGLSAVMGRKLVVTKNLIDLDLPLLAISTMLLLGVVWDREVTLGEAILMLLTYGIYLAYTIVHQETEIGQTVTAEAVMLEKEAKPAITGRDIILLILGLMGLVFGAHYLIESLVALSSLLKVATGVIAITAVAVGTSLPELLVSVKAALKNKSELALGNIFGSNIFNSFVVIGLPGLFARLHLDEQTFAIGLPTLAATTLLFVISGISRQVHRWEGAFFLSLYVLFMAKLFRWF